MLAHLAGFAMCLLAIFAAVCFDGVVAHATQSGGAASQRSQRGAPSFVETGAKASMSAAAYAEALSEARATVRELEEREQRYLDVLGPQEKIKFDNIRRSAEWLFKQGRLQEGAVMFSRATEVYGDALKKPLKDFADVAALGSVVRRRKVERAAADALAAAGGAGGQTAQAEAVFLEFARACDNKARRGAGAEAADADADDGIDWAG